MMLNTSWIQSYNIIQMTISWCCWQHILLFSTGVDSPIICCCCLHPMPLLKCGCWLSPGGGESVGPSWSRIWHNELPMCRRQRWQERTPIWWLQDDRYQRSWWQARTPIWWLQDDYDEGSCCCHSCQNRKGECRESWLQTWRCTLSGWGKWAIFH